MTNVTKGFAQHYRFAIGTDKLHIAARNLEQHCAIVFVVGSLLL